MASSAQAPTMLITGCSSGIGRATAQHFASLGWEVYGTVRKQADASELKAAGGVHAVLMDITDEESVRSGVQQVAAACGPRGLNVLINNAGMAVYGALETIQAQMWRQVFETNVFGMATVTRHCLPLLRLAVGGDGKGPGGRVINIGSAAGRLTAPLQSVYTASKHAVEGMNDCLRAELAPQKIQVVLMQLGAVATAMATKIRAASLPRSTTLQPTQPPLPPTPTTTTTTTTTTPVAAFATLMTTQEEELAAAAGKATTAAGGGGGGAAGGASGQAPQQQPGPGQVGQQQPGPGHTAQQQPEATSGAQPNSVDPVAALYAVQVKETEELFTSLESTSIPMKVVLKALEVAATTKRPATRYAVDGEIAMSLWLRWALGDRGWDWFYPRAMSIAKSRAAKVAAKKQAHGQ